MNPPTLVLVLLVVAAIGITISGAPLSLATDIGVTDQDICDALDKDGAHAVQRLQHTGFPHASLDDVERYRLTRSGTPEAAIEIDWKAGTATCLPNTYNGPVTAELQLSERAYRVAVGELIHVVQTGDLAKGGWGNRLALLFGSDISIPGNPDYEPTYKRTLAQWAAGQLAGTE